VAGLRRIVTQCAVPLLVAASAVADRLGPEPVTPVIANGIRYSAEGDGRDQFVVAADATSCKVLWRTHVLHVEVEPSLEEDVQWVFITNLEVAGNALLVTDERSDRFSVDLTTHEVQESSYGGLLWRLFAAPAASHRPSIASPETRTGCPSETVMEGFVEAPPGESEATLAGVTLNRTTVSDLKKRVPAPLSVKTYSPGSASVVAWEEAGLRISVSFAGQLASAVAVTGKSTPASKTGRGLALGRSIADLERIYGRFCRIDDGRNYYILRWSDGTELRAHVPHANFDHPAAKERIASLELLASVE
jgi:hypothetical protein